MMLRVGSAGACMLGAALALAVTALPFRARAHDLEVDTARIELRDGHVTVYASVDVETWVMQSAGLDGPLPLATMGPSELDAFLSALQVALVEETRLRQGDVDVPLRILRFPSRDEVLRVAAGNLMGSRSNAHHHRQRLDIQLEAERSLPTETRVAISFPRSFEALSVSFVEPQSRWVSSAELASFESFSARSTITPTTPITSETTMANASPLFFMASIASSVLAALAGIWIGRRRKLIAPVLPLGMALLSLGGCSGTEAPAEATDAPTISPTDTSGGSRGVTRYEGEAWADNWFAMYLGDELLVEDSVPITTERSFNAERFSFEATPPFVLSFVLRDYTETNSGLEYIGLPNQQIGDGGFIAQIRDSRGGVVVSNASWRCLTIQRAPLNRACVSSATPDTDCEFELLPEPEGWHLASYDDSAWQAADVFTAAQVQPKDGYDLITWDASAQFIWGEDLLVDNTILCRLRVE